MSIVSEIIMDAIKVIGKLLTKGWVRQPLIIKVRNKVPSKEGRAFKHLLDSGNDYLFQECSVFILSYKTVLGGENIFAKLN